MFRIRRPQICGHVISREPFFLAFVLDLIHIWIEGRKLGRADQNLLLSGRRVHIPQLAFLTLFVALYKGELRSIRTPFRRLRATPRQPPGLKQRLNREGFSWSGLGLRDIRATKASDQCYQGKTGQKTRLSFHEVTSQERNNKAKAKE